MKIFYLWLKETSKDIQYSFPYGVNIEYIWIWFFFCKIFRQNVRIRGGWIEAVWIQGKEESISRKVEAKIYFSSSQFIFRTGGGGHDQESILFLVLIGSLLLNWPFSDPQPWQVRMKWNLSLSWVGTGGSGLFGMPVPGGVHGGGFLGAAQ